MHTVISAMVAVAAKFDPASWIKDRKADQNKWKKTSPSYKTVIDKMMALGGDFVFIAKKGDPFIEVLARSAKKFRSKVSLISNQGDSRTRQFVVQYAHKDPERYRICIGYCLVTEEGLSFWVKHYWLYDKEKKLVLECTPVRRRFYFGVMLSKDGTMKLTAVTRTTNAAPKVPTSKPPKEGSSKPKPKAPTKAKAPPKAKAK